LGYEITREKANQCMDTFKESWKVTFGTIGLLVGAWFCSLLLPVFLLAIGTGLGALLDHVAGHRGSGIFTLLGMVVPGLLIGCLYGGRMRIVLGVVDQRGPKFSELLLPIPLMINTCIAFVISTAAVGLGSMALVLPGAFLYVKLQLAPFFILDHDVGFMTALKMSWKETGPIFIQLALLDLIFFVLSWVTGFTFVGPFLILIVSEVAAAIVYRKWLGANQTPAITVEE
jgi:hypothetical protein